MKNFVFGSLVTIVASGAAGCIISSDNSGAFCGDGILDPGESCDDGNNASGDGCSSVCSLEVTPHTTHATWSVQDISGANSGCPTVGGVVFDTAIVVSWKVNANGDHVGTCTPGGSPSDSCYLDIFSCSAGSGTTGPIPDTTKFPNATGGTFDTFVAITNHSGATVYAESLSDLEDLTTANGVFPNDPDHLHGTIYNNGGYFTAAWTLKGVNSGSTLSCSQAASGGVSILSTVTGGSQGVDDIFKCSDGNNPYIWTGGLLEGSYTVSVSALDMGNPGLALGAPTNKSAEIIQGQNQVTDLGALVLNVDGQ